MKATLTESQVREYKTILGIPANEALTTDSIKKAYRKKSIELHPDRHGNTEEAKANFQKLQDANEKLNAYVNRDKTNAKYQKDIAELEKELNKINTRINEINNTGKASSVRQAEIDELKSKIDNATSEELDELSQTARNIDPSLSTRISERKTFLDRVKQLEERIDKAKTEKELDAYLDSVNKLPNSKEKTALLDSIEAKRKSIKT